MSKKNVEAVFPLSPMQRGMLLHSLHTSGPDPGALHVRCRLEGPLYVEAFQAAWDQVVRRHTVLRTVLRWEGLDEPLQIVLRSGELPIAVADLRSEAPKQQRERIEDYVAADRKSGLDLSQTPTSRVALFQTGDTEWHLIWSCHHVLLDGWSSALVLNEVLAITNARQLDGDLELASAPPFQDYVRWLKRQPEADAQAFWQSELAGVTAPTPLPVGPPEPGAWLSGIHVDPELGRPETATLREVARRHGVTLSTLVQASWGLVLSGLSGEERVVFDATTSGRGIDLPGVEAMAGMLINTVPIRINVEPEDSVMDVCRRLHAVQADRDRFAYIEPAQIQAWSDVPAHQRLSESLLVIENYPVGDSSGDGLRIADLQSGVTSSYPLTLIVTPGDTLRLHALGSRLSEAAVRSVLDHVLRVLERVAASPETPARALLAEIEPQRTEASERAGEPILLDRGDDFVPPVSATERALAAIWEDVLCVAPIGVTDGFFEMGGNSVMSAQVMARAKEAGLEIKTGDFFAHPTIRGLAHALDGTEASEAFLVPLAPSGSKPPLFIVHGWGGKLFVYLKLARQLGDDQPVYGLQDIDREDPADGFQTLDAMAARYAEEIRASHPDGPVHLLGFSAGGTIAYAVAEHLHRAGAEVGTVFILDTFPPNLPPHVHAQVIRPFLVERAKHHASSVIRSPQRAVGTIRRLIQTAKKEFSVPESDTRQLATDTVPDLDPYVALRKLYVPPPCPLQIVLIESSEAKERYDLARAWRYLVGDAVEKHQVDAEDHMDVVAAPVETGVIQIIREGLERATSG